MKKTIIHIVNTGNFSGAERVVIQIIINYRMINKDTTFIYAGKNGKIIDILKENNIEYYNLNVRNYFEVRKMIKNVKPDIIHAHDFSASFFTNIMLRKIPVISHIHNNPPWIKNMGVKSFIFLFSIIRSKKVLLVSQAIISEYYFGKLLTKKAEIIGNPLDLKTVCYDRNLINSKEYDIIFIGRLTEQKDPLRFLHLVKNIKKKFPDLSVVMVGDGELKEECQEYIIDNDLEDTIKMTGFILNPYDIIKRSKLLCMTSKWEGFGLVAFEAYACDIPVVGSPVGGLVNLIDDRCGKLCTTNEEYVSEIYNLLTNEKYLNDKISGAKRKAVELNNIEEYIANINKIYKDVLEE